MRHVSELADFDCFFFYGQNPLDLEIESDLMAGMLQNKHSMFYNRSYGAGINENYPNSLTQAVILPYNIAQHVGIQNQKISDGNDPKYPDRRIAVSQAAIQVQQSNNEMLVVVPYISFSDYSQMKGVVAPIGV